jgi:hypothetical protein
MYSYYGDMVFDGNGRVSHSQTIIALSMSLFEVRGYHVENRLPQLLWSFSPENPKNPA